MKKKRPPGEKPVETNVIPHKFSKPTAKLEIVTDTQHRSILMFNESFEDINMKVEPYLFGMFRYTQSEVYNSMINNLDDDQVRDDELYVYNFVCTMAGIKYNLDTEAVETLYHTSVRTDYEDRVVRFVEHIAEYIILAIAEIRKFNIGTVQHA